MLLVGRLLNILEQTEISSTCKMLLNHHACASNLAPLRVFFPESADSRERGWGNSGSNPLFQMSWGLVCNDLTTDSIK